MPHVKPAVYVIAVVCALMAMGFFFRGESPEMQADQEWQAHQRVLRAFPDLVIANLEATPYDTLFTTTELQLMLALKTGQRFDIGDINAFTLKAGEGRYHFQRVTVSPSIRFWTRVKEINDEP